MFYRFCEITFEVCAYFFETGMLGGEEGVCWGDFIDEVGKFAVL